MQYWLKGEAEGLWSLLLPQVCVDLSIHWKIINRKLWQLFRVLFLNPEMPKSHWFRLLKCECLLVFWLPCDSKTESLLVLDFWLDKTNNLNTSSSQHFSTIFWHFCWPTFKYTLHNRMNTDRRVRWRGRTHVGFVVTGLKDELLGVMLPVLHRSGRGGLVGRTQRDRLAPLACLKRQPIAH